MRLPEASSRCRCVPGIGAFQERATSARPRAHCSRRGFAEDHSLVGETPHHAGRHHFRRGIDHGADAAFRLGAAPDGPPRAMHSAGAFAGGDSDVEVPPRIAFEGAHPAVSWCGSARMPATDGAIECAFSVTRTTACLPTRAVASVAGNRLRVPRRQAGASRLGVEWRRDAPPCDDGSVRPGVRQQHRQVAAHGTGTEDAGLHASSPGALARPTRWTLPVALSGSCPRRRCGAAS